MKKSLLKKLKHIFSLTIVNISIMMMKITAYAEVAALEYKEVSDDGTEVTESLLGMLCTCVSYMGGACMLVGIIMIALALKDDNPEKKTKATVITITGIVFFFFAETLKNAGIISEYS
jgi:hypothetical protein